MISELTVDGARHIGEKMRQSDIDIMAATSFHDDQCLYAVSRISAPGPKWMLSLDETFATGERVATEPVAMGGFYLVCPGTYNAWLIAAPNWVLRKKEALRHMKWALRLLLESGAALRVQAMTFEKSEQAHALAKHVGFEFEATLRNYANGANAFLWSKVK